MPRRAALVSQADITRAIRAAKDAGLPVLRIVVRPDGVAVETSADPAPEAAGQQDVATQERVVVL